MEAIIEFYTNIDIFLLVFTRMIALLTIVPIFSEKSVPEITKAGLALVVTIIMMYASPAMTVTYAL